MPGVFTRKSLAEIMGNEALTPEERTDQVFSLYGRALDDGYITKLAAKAAQDSAIEQAKTEWEKSVQKPNVKESEEYKQLQSQFDDYRTMQNARTSDDFKEVKPKFFETVYGMVSREDGAKPIAEQLNGIRAQYEEYFTATQEPKSTPQFSQQPGHPGTNPVSEEDKLYKQLADNWK